jgi:hypothetical protein
MMKDLSKQCAVTSGEEAQLVDVVETQARLSDYSGYRLVHKKIVEWFVTPNSTRKEVCNKLEALWNLTTPIENLSWKISDEREWGWIRMLQDARQSAPSLKVEPLVNQTLTVECVNPFWESHKHESSSWGWTIPMLNHKDSG